MRMGLSHMHMHPTAIQYTHMGQAHTRIWDCLICVCMELSNIPMHIRAWAAAAATTTAAAATINLHVKKYNMQNKTHS